MSAWVRVRRELPAVIPGLILAVTLATLPYGWTGERHWIADYDELAFYLPVGAQAYREHPWRLTDVVTGGATYYQPLSVVPVILLAKALGLGPWLLGLCWRLWGGICLALLWYVALRLRLRPWSAAVATLLVLSDPGVLQGQLGYALIRTGVRHLSGEELGPTPTAAALPQWRIWNPLLTWPWWLAFLILTSRAAERPTRGRLLAAGLSCGLLFHIYFYFWTTAVVGLLLACLIDRHRAVTYLSILGLGLLVGMPAWVAAVQFRQQYGSDWLHRTDKFLPVPRGSELLIPRVSLLLLLLAWGWVWRRGEEVRLLACMATAALLLLNHTLLTGWQIENFHWNFALGPALSLLVVFLVADLSRYSAWLQRWGRLLGGVGTAGVVGVALLLWARACTILPENLHIRRVTQDYQSQALNWSLPAGSAVAGDPDFQYLAAIDPGLRPLSGYTAVLSPIRDHELAERLALNACLLGYSREQFAAEQQEQLRRSRWGAEARSATARAERLAERLAAWDAVCADLSAAVRRYNVHLVARPATAAGEPPLPNWIRLDHGPRWTLYLRRD
jgi:hypothetical protein